MTTFEAYWSVIDRHARLLAVLATLMLGANGLLEGSALLVLIPVLEGGLQTSTSHIGRFWLSVTAWFGLPDALALPAALCVFALLGVCAALLRLVAEGLVLKVRLAAESSARSGMARALLGMDWSSYLTLRHGEIHKAIMVEGAQIASGIQALLAGIGAGITAAFYLLTAVYMSVEMTIYTIAFGAAIGVAYLLATRRVRRHFSRTSSILSLLADQVTTVFGHLKFFRVAGQAAVAGDRTDTLFARYAEASFQGQIYTPLMRALFEGGAVLFIAAFLFWRVHFEHESAAVTLIFLAIFYRLAPRLVSAQEGVFQARNNMPWFSSWRERMDFATGHPGVQSGSLVPALDGGIVFDHVGFTYPGSERRILEDVSFELRAGECMAVVGASGSGKTTVLDLLSGLLQPQTGRILLGGASLDRLDLDAWRSRIGIVMQDSPVFHMTVFENVTWGGDDPDRARAVDCLRMAHALEFVQALPEGADTLVGDKGARLSGGQRQRIAIARALYRNPWLLILDEATSALDGESEDAIQAALQEQKGKFAMIMVAHRLKTVRMADRIMVLEKGTVAESGTWDELAKNGRLFPGMLVRQDIGD